MIVNGIIATTEIDRQNTRISKEALEKAADRINNSGSVPLIGLEHDRTIMPLGKVLSAKVSPMSNGEYKMENTQEIFEEEYSIELHDGMKFVMTKSSYDDRPFTENEIVIDNIKISVDFVNFESRAEFIEMQELIESYNIQNGIIGRKSLIPDPEIIIEIGQSIGMYLIGKSVIDSVGDRVLNNVMDEVDKFYLMMRGIIVKYSKLAFPKNRPQTYVFMMKEECNVELVAISNSPDEVMKSISGESLKTIGDKLDDLRVHFKLSRVQFLYEDGEWIFNYLFTSNGEVIGTEKSYNRKVKAIELYKNKISE